MEVKDKMNHSDSIRLLAAEKYLLGELPDDTREEFEEHYFACEECAEDLRLGAALIEHSKVILAEAPPQDAPHRVKPESSSGQLLGWLRPAFLVPVMAVLLAVVGYQNFVTYPRLSHRVASLDKPALMASVSLIESNTRGVSRGVVNVQKGQPFLLYLDIPDDSRFTSYKAELLGPSGELDWSLVIPAAQAKNTLPIRAPRAPDGSGSYTLVVKGISSDNQASEVGKYPFDLQIQQ